MIHLTDVTGLLGEAVAIAAVASEAPGVSRLAPRARTAFVAAVAVFALVPLGGMPLAGYLRGAVGDLSLTSLLLLGLYLARFMAGGATAAFPTGGRQALLALLAAAALGFYPMALGWGGFDPYRLGYGSYALLASLLALALWGALQRRPVVAAAITLAVAGWSAGWYESANLWDYLMDPLVSAYALGALARRGVRKMRGQPPSQ
jgi:hypothetical protein